MEIFISGYGSSKVDADRFTDVEDELIESWIATHGVKLTSSGLESLPVVGELTGLSLPMNSGEKSSIKLPVGLTVIFGRTNTGKSLLVDHLSTKLNVPIVRFCEPELPALLNPHKVIKKIEEFLESDSKIFLLDSLRFWIFRDKTDSSALKGGINSGLFIDLTALSLVAAYHDKSIVAVINPMTDDATVLEMMAHNTEGSTAAVIQTRSPGEFSFVARTFDNLRTKVNYAFQLPDRRDQGLGQDHKFDERLDDLAFDGREINVMAERWNRMISKQKLKVQG